MEPGDGPHRQRRHVRFGLRYPVTGDIAIDEPLPAVADRASRMHFENRIDAHVKDRKGVNVTYYPVSLFGIFLFVFIGFAIAFNICALIYLFSLDDRGQWKNTKRGKKREKHQ